FGPRNEKSRDAANQVEAGGGAAITSEIDLTIRLGDWLGSAAGRDLAGSLARAMVEKNLGAAERSYELVATLLLRRMPAPGASVALVAEFLETTTEFRIILDRGSLRDLDHDFGRILHVESVDVERRIREVRRIDVHEEQLAVLEQLAHSLDGALPTEAAQIPDQVGLGGDLEQHFRPPHAAHGAASQRCVAEHHWAGGDGDWMALAAQPAR